MVDLYAALLELTINMRDALAAQDIEAFAKHVDSREAVIASIGRRRPATEAERKCLEQATAMDAQVRESAELTWRSIIGDLKQLKSGRLASAAYFRTMLGADPEDNSRFIDKTK